MRHLDEAIDVLRNCGERLIPYNFPQNSPLYEDYIYPLKISQVEVDGYSIELHFSKADYGEYYFETLQISGVNNPFLPFHVVIKIAKKCLGNRFLTLIRTPRQGKIYYCWTCFVDKSGKLIPCSSEKVTKCEFEGFEFNNVSPNSVNFH